MEREILLTALKRVAPAMLAKGPNTVLSSICFAKNQVLAYDERVGISAPLNAPGADGSVNGSILISILSASKAKDVSMEWDGSLMRLKAGRSRLKLAVTPASEFPFHGPGARANETSRCKLTPELWAALTHPLLVPDEGVEGGGGVTLFFDGGQKKVILYSTSPDELTATRIACPFKVPTILRGELVAIATRFCKLLVSHPRDDRPTELVCYKHGIAAQTPSGCLLFGCATTQPSYKEWARLFDVHGTTESHFRLPAAFKGCLERSSIIVAAGGGPAVEVKLEKDRCHFLTQGPMGDLRDAVRLADFKGKEQSIRFSPQRFLKALPYTRTVGIGSAIRMVDESGDLTHLLGLVRDI